jgi:hypothetical protein
MVCLFVIAAVGGLHLVRRLVPMELRMRHNDVVGFIYAVLGVAYAVLLGLMVVAVWEEWEAAKETANDEASELAEVFWLAHRLPESQGRRVQELAREYARVVVEVEWPLMKRGETSSRAWALLDEIRGAVVAQSPATDGEQVLYAQMLDRVHELGDARRDRLLEAREGLPAILWVVLVVGAVVVVGFTYLFGLENTTTHTLMVAALALVISLVLFTVGALNYPFKGDIRVQPDAFELVLGRFDAQSREDQ